MPYNPKSLAGLTRAGKGQPKKNRVKKLLSVSPETAEWIDSQPHKGEAIDKAVKYFKERKAMIELKTSRSLDVLPGRILSVARGNTGKIPAGTVFLWDGVPTETTIEVEEKETGKKYIVSVFETALEEV